ncbi:hypothetical protein Tco_0101754, partial [Tanacetum coccineum]
MVNIRTFNPDLIGPWLQQFWATASLSSIHDVPHISAVVAGKRADLLFDDADGVDFFPKQNSPKFSGRITPLTPPMLEVITALAAEEAHSTAGFQGTAKAQGAADIPQSSNDYTPTDASQTSG